MATNQPQQSNGDWWSAQGSSRLLQAAYPFFLPFNTLANTSSFGQQYSSSILSSSVAAASAERYYMAPLPFPTVASSPSSAHYCESMIHVATQANPACPIQRQQFFDELTMQFRMPLLARPVPVSATPLDPHTSPAIGSTTLATTTTIHSFQTLISSSKQTPDKRKISSKEATASLRRKEHKEVEIKRRR